jgi:hypothetical protein
MFLSVVMSVSGGLNMTRMYALAPSLDGSTLLSRDSWPLMYTRTSPAHDTSAQCTQILLDDV